MSLPEYRDMTGKGLICEGFEYKKYPNGYEGWWRDGKRHRLDGPAFKNPDRSVSYWLEGVHIPKEDFDHAWTCPMTELPLLINKDVVLIAKWRLEHGT